jgi:hypothetical protein
MRIAYCALRIHLILGPRFASPASMSCPSLGLRNSSDPEASAGTKVFLDTAGAEKRTLSKSGSEILGR